MSHELGPNKTTDGNKKTSLVSKGQVQLGQIEAEARGATRGRQPEAAVLKKSPKIGHPQVYETLKDHKGVSFSRLKT